jgi:hypothetical protein
MADKHEAQCTPEGAAFILMELVQRVEQPPTLDRKVLLDLYAECLQAVKQPELRTGVQLPTATGSFG